MSYGSASPRCGRNEMTYRIEYQDLATSEYCWRCCEGIYSRSDETQRAIHDLIALLGAGADVPTECGRSRRLHRPPMRIWCAWLSASAAKAWSSPSGPARMDRRLSFLRRMGLPRRCRGARLGEAGSSTDLSRRWCGSSLRGIRRPWRRRAAAVEAQERAAVQERVSRSTGSWTRSAPPRRQSMRRSRAGFAAA